MTTVDIPAICVARRGERFPADKKTIALYIGRSKNKNIVVYDVKAEASPEHGGAKLAADTVDAHWLDLEPSYQAKNRAKGKMDDRDELNFVDKWQAYGIKVVDLKPHTAELQFVALPKKQTILHLEKAGDGSFVAMVKCQISGVDNAVLERIWVEVDESGWIPKVLHIDLFGVHPTSGENITERIMN